MVACFGFTSVSLFVETFFANTNSSFATPEVIWPALCLRISPNNPCRTLTSAYRRSLSAFKSHKLSRASSTVRALVSLCLSATPKSDFSLYNCLTTPPFLRQVVQQNNNALLQLLPSPLTNCRVLCPVDVYTSRVPTSHKNHTVIRADPAQLHFHKFHIHHSPLLFFWESALLVYLSWILHVVGRLLPVTIKITQSEVYSNDY